jgi:uncharacterized protein YgiB involved in biofilm formation
MNFRPLLAPLALAVLVGLFGCSQDQTATKAEQVMPKNLSQRSYATKEACLADWHQPEDCTVKRLDTGEVSIIGPLFLYWMLSGNRQVQVYHSNGVISNSPAPTRRTGVSESAGHVVAAGSVLGVAMAARYGASKTSAAGRSVARGGFGAAGASHASDGGGHSGVGGGHSGGG